VLPQRFEAAILSLLVGIASRRVREEFVGRNHIRRITAIVKLSGDQGPIQFAYLYRGRSPGWLLRFRHLIPIVRASAFEDHPRVAWNGDLEPIRSQRLKCEDPRRDGAPPRPFRLFIART
jgi:hypothetical protein